MKTPKRLRISTKDNNEIWIAYILFSKRFCVYSMVNRPVKNDNSVMNVRRIISEVTASLCIDVHSARYFDLQTTLSLSHANDYDYDFTEACIKRSPTHTDTLSSFVFNGWKATECPLKVLFPFRFLVNPNPKFRSQSGRQTVHF